MFFFGHRLSNLEPQNLPEADVFDRMGKIYSASDLQGHDKHFNAGYNFFFVVLGMSCAIYDLVHEHGYSRYIPSMYVLAQS